LLPSFMVTIFARIFLHRQKVVASSLRRDRL
jgi:hypothetical protein